MIQRSAEVNNWPWECVGTHEGAAFLGSWQARAYIAERPGGWYASADGWKAGPEYTYHLPGRNTASGPYTREQAESPAREMIGLAPDASIPPATQLVLYQGPTGTGREGREAKDVTGRRWMPYTGTQARSCTICGRAITTGWSQGRGIEAQHHVCEAHVEVHLEARPADGR